MQTTKKTEREKREKIATKTPRHEDIKKNGSMETSSNKDTKEKTNNQCSIKKMQDANI